VGPVSKWSIKGAVTSFVASVLIMLLRLEKVSEGMAHAEESNVNRNRLRLLLTRWVIMKGVMVLKICEENRGWVDDKKEQINIRH